MSSAIFFVDKRIKGKSNQENLAILIKITDVFQDVEKSDN